MRALCSNRTRPDQILTRRACRVLQKSSQVRKGGNEIGNMTAVAPKPTYPRAMLWHNDSCGEMWTRWSHCAEPSRDSFGSSLSLPIPPRDQDGPDQISLAATARYPTRAELGIWNPLGVAQRGLHDAAVEPERRRLSRLHLAMDSKCTIRAPVNSSPGLIHEPRALLWRPGQDATLSRRDLASWLW